MKWLNPTANRRLNEVIGLCGMAAALLTLLSLVSFSPADPSFNSDAASGEAGNLGGVIGSYAADLLYQLFGVSALLLPLPLGWMGWTWFRSKQSGLPKVKILGALLLWFSLLGALGIFPYPLRLYHLFPAGGVAGVLLGDALRYWLNPVGSAILLLVTAVTSLYLLTSFSMEKTSAWCQNHFGWLAVLERRWESWKQALAQRRRQRRQESGRGTAAAPSAKPLSSPVPPPPRQTDTFQEPWEEGAEIPISPLAQNALGSTARDPEPVISRLYKLPGTGLLQMSTGSFAVAEEELKQRALQLTRKYEEFDVSGAVTQINPGPVVTTFEFKPDAGIKYNRITNLVEDLCLALEAESILIERIPGKSTIGIEVPNVRRETIFLREMLESEAFTSDRSPLTLALGKEINGRIRVADLASMPHLLIAGSTGSGKSVAINCMILSILYKATPEDVRLILVDPKRLELGLYEGIPHLLTPIITDAKVAANALRNCVREMERRLKLLAEKSVRNIEQYNRLLEREGERTLFAEEETESRLPYIVIFIDELADLMMVDSSNVEISITRLAQMARAVGIHLVLATQRPSVDVLTGLIKANFPARISFRVATKVDSRTILDSNGSEALLGRGDMLFSPPGSGRLVRVHGPLVTESEIAAVVEFWRSQAIPSYADEFLKAPAGEDEEEEQEWSGEKDEMYEDAVKIVVGMGKASTSTLQRRLRLGYGRAARILDVMEKDGIIGPADGSRPREVLKRPDWIDEFERSQNEV